MILETKISKFDSTTDTEVKDTITVGELLGQIKSGTYIKSVKLLRSGDKEAKRFLPTFAAHGLFENYRKKDNFIEASGLIILDIDDVEEDEIEETKQDIMDESDHVLAVMTSPSRDGIKVLYYVNPDLVTADNYRQIGKQLVSDFDSYGDVDYLSITDCLIMTYDENLLINEEATPAYIYVKEVLKVEGTLEERDESKELWDNPEDFFDTVLANDIQNKTNNNFHYIQVAILDLAKFGFYHPKEDLSFVIDYAESAFKVSSDNKKRFDEVTELAKDYPQIKWPYKFIQSEEDDDEYMDYSQYMDEDVITENKEDGEDGGDGLIDYDKFFDKVIETVEEGDRVGFETSHKEFAELFRFKGTGILTVTGIPGHGKTEFVDACVIDLARLYGHETIMAGFEQTPQEHVIKLIRKVVGVDITCPSWFNESNKEELDKAYKFVVSKIKHIDTNKSGGNINKILEIAAKQIKKSRDAGGDPKYMVLDPFNMLSIKGKFSGHEKIEEILRRLTHFSHQMGIMVILIAHPFKMKIDEKTGQYQIPDFYSVKGSSAFFEMSYHGWTIYRQVNGRVLVKILKVKQNNLGKAGGEVLFEYERAPGRYVSLDEAGNEISGDHREKDWLDKALKVNNKKK